MIGYISGKVVGQIGKQVIVRIPSGVGYLVNVGEGEMFMQNDTFERFVLQVDREDSQELYGFRTIDERKWVEKFLKVNGVGPKMAANIVHSMGTQHILSALNSKDAKAFGTVKGLGTKTAKKILLELKGNEIRVEDLEMAVDSKSRTVTDFTETLINLGYRRGQVVQVIQQMKKDGIWEEKDLKEMIRTGIKYLSN